MNEYLIGIFLFVIWTAYCVYLGFTAKENIIREKEYEKLKEEHNKAVWRICIYKNFDSKQVCTPYIDFNCLNLETIRKKLMKVQGKYAEICYIQNDEIYIDRSVINEDFICKIIQSTSIF